MIVHVLLSSFIFQVVIPVFFLIDRNVVRFKYCVKTSPPLLLVKIFIKHCRFSLLFIVSLGNCTMQLYFQAVSTALARLFEIGGGSAVITVCPT